MIEIILYDKDPSYVISIVGHIRSLGYVQGKDFDFAYKPPYSDNFSGDVEYNRKTLFTFYTEELASWFSLRYIDDFQK